MLSATADTAEYALPLLASWSACQRVTSLPDNAEQPHALASHVLFALYRAYIAPTCLSALPVLCNPEFHTL